MIEKSNNQWKRIIASTVLAGTVYIIVPKPLDKPYCIEEQGVDKECTEHSEPKITTTATYSPNTIDVYYKK